MSVQIVRRSIVTLDNLTATLMIKIKFIESFHDYRKPIVILCFDQDYNMMPVANTNKEHIIKCLHLLCHQKASNFELFFAFESASASLNKQQQEDISLSDRGDYRENFRLQIVDTQFDCYQRASFCGFSTNKIGSNFCLKASTNKAFSLSDRDTIYRNCFRIINIAAHCA